MNANAHIRATGVTSPNQTHHSLGGRNGNSTVLEANVNPRGQRAWLRNIGKEIFMGAASIATIRVSRKSKLKPRHAAVLALVSWYLMMPPVRCKREPVVLVTLYCRVPSDCHVDSDKPIANWTPLATFADDAICRHAQEQMPCLKLVEANCVSANDPPNSGAFFERL